MLNKGVIFTFLRRMKISFSTESLKLKKKESTNISAFSLIILIGISESWHNLKFFLQNRFFIYLRKEKWQSWVVFAYFSHQEKGRMAPTCFVIIDIFLIKISEIVRFRFFQKQNTCSIVLNTSFCFLHFFFLRTCFEVEFL